MVARRRRRVPGQIALETNSPDDGEHLHLPDGMIAFVELVRDGLAGERIDDQRRS